MIERFNRIPVKISAIFFVHYRQDYTKSFVERLKYFGKKKTIKRKDSVYPVIIYYII